MLATYNPWLVSLSLLVAVAVSFTSLKLAGRVAEAGRSGARAWLIGGAASMGIGIWSMHFIGMLAYQAPIPLHYNVLMTLLSLLIAVLTSGFALGIASGSQSTLPRLAASSLVMGAGICAMHYTGMAAIQMKPAIRYNMLWIVTSMLIAVTASFVALWLFFALRRFKRQSLRRIEVSAAIVMGAAIAGMHYTGMRAAEFPAQAQVLGGAAFNSDRLGLTIGLGAFALLAITLITLVYDAHLESRSRQDALRLEKLNQELQHGKNLLTLATQAAGIACWEFDLSNGRLLWTENEIASLKASNLDVRTHIDVLLARIHPEDAAQARATLRQAARARRETCALRLRIECPHGRIHLESHARVLRDARGRIARLLGVSWDVTEQVRQEERRVMLQLQLQEASRQAGMAEVATGVLHSVGNVLNSLGVSVALLSRHLRESRVGNVKRVATLLGEHSPALGDFLTHDRRGRELPAYLQQLGERLLDENRDLYAEVRALCTHVEHIEKIIAAQQAYARRGGVLERVEVTELIEHAIVLHFPAAEDISVRKEYQPIGALIIDRHKVLQILANLLSNARQAMRTGGREKVLTVRVRRAQAECFQIEIEDTGSGISPEAMQRLFEFGFTTKQDGHGFGLHSSAILATEMGGELRAESGGVGCGACFRLRLPITGAAAEPQRLSA